MESIAIDVKTNLKG